MDQAPALTDKLIDISLIDPNPQNPNKMSPRQFNLLVDNLKLTGFVDPVFVRFMPETQRYRVVGGHHRLDAAKHIGLTAVPCRVRDDPAFDDDAERFQLMRMNMIRGKLDVQKFMGLYQTVADRYSQEELTEAFGFEEEAALARLVQETKKSLPNELKAKFELAAKDVKTIDGLALLLNRLFTQYGDTLPYGYMMIDFGGKDSVWLRMHASDRKRFDQIASMCMDNQRTVDSLFRVALQLIADGALPQVTEALMKMPAVELPKEKPKVLTEELLGLLSE